MTSFIRGAAALAVALATQTPIAANAAGAPVKGSWSRVTIFIAKATNCPSALKAGLSTAGQLFFAGGGIAGSKLYFYAPGTASSTVDIYAMALPALPSTNGGQSTGTISLTDLASGTSFSGNATATLNYGTPNGYFATLSGTVIICSLTLNMTALQTGT